MELRKQADALTLWLVRAGTREEWFTKKEQAVGRLEQLDARGVEAAVYEVKGNGQRVLLGPSPSQ
jgi:hypothetical protein